MVRNSSSFWSWRWWSLLLEVGIRSTLLWFVRSSSQEHKDHVVVVRAIRWDPDDSFKPTDGQVQGSVSEENLVCGPTFRSRCGLVFQQLIWSASSSFGYGTISSLILFCFRYGLNITNLLSMETGMWTMQKKRWPAVAYLLTDAHAFCRFAMRPVIKDCASWMFACAPYFCYKSFPSLFYYFEVRLVVQNDHDPPWLVSEMLRKLMRFLVADGTHLDANSPYAEVEVMTMCMPLTSPAAGTRSFKLAEGSARMMIDLLDRKSVV